MVKYKFYYYPARGRGEFVRYIFAYADVPYEEITTRFEDWVSTWKQKMPFGIIPVLELEDGRQLSQSLAIARFLAKKHGLLSDDDFDNAWGDQLACTIEDMYPRHYRPFVFATLIEKNEEKRKEAWENMRTNGLMPLFEKFENILGDKTYFSGKKLHWSDLVIAEFTDRAETFDKSFFGGQGFSSKYPRLYAHCQRIHEIPQIKKYIEKRPNYFL